MVTSHLIVILLVFLVCRWWCFRFRFRSFCGFLNLDNSILMRMKWWRILNAIFNRTKSSVRTTSISIYCFRSTVVVLIDSHGFVTNDKRNAQRCGRLYMWHMSRLLRSWRGFGVTLKNYVILRTIPGARQRTWSGETFGEVQSRSKKVFRNDILYDLVDSWYKGNPHNNVEFRTSNLKIAYNSSSDYRGAKF